MKSWWARRWMKALRAGGNDSRFARGRTYALDGNVLWVDIRPGTVVAAVQGSRKYPYNVEIKVKPLPESQWAKVALALARETRLLTGLLSGEMTEELDEALQREDISLFPGIGADISHSCTCPDWGNPCKHVAAVYYRLADLLDENPALMFALRGKSFEEVMADVRRVRASAGRLSAGPGAGPGFGPGPGVGPSPGPGLTPRPFAYSPLPFKDEGAVVLRVLREVQDIAMRKAGEAVQRQG